MARDIDAAQTATQQTDKSKGWAPILGGKETAAATHGSLRHLVGFDLRQFGREYRRATGHVLNYGAASSMQKDPPLTEVTRLNAAVDQALADRSGFAYAVDRSRDTFLNILGHDLAPAKSGVDVIGIPHGPWQGEPRSTSGSLVLITQSVLTMSLMIRDLLEYARTLLATNSCVSTSRTTSA